MRPCINRYCGGCVLYCTVFAFVDWIIIGFWELRSIYFCSVVFVRSAHHTVVLPTACLLARSLWSSHDNLLTWPRFFRSTSNFGSRPNTMGGKFPPVCPYVRPSTKSFFDFDEIWYTGSTRWEMKKGNDHARIQGQGQELTKVGNSTILDHFQTISSPISNGGWQMTTDS